MVKIPKRQASQSHPVQQKGSESDSGTGDEKQGSPQPQSAKLKVTVVRADGLPRRGFTICKQRFFVSVTDGGTKKNTTVVSSKQRAVQWDAVLGEFTIKPSPGLTLYVFEKRRLHKDGLVGQVEISFDSLLPSSPHDLDLVVGPKDGGAPGPSKQRPTIRLTVTPLESHPSTSTEAVNAAGPRDVGVKPTERADQPEPLDAVRAETEAVADRLRGADEAVGDMSHPLEPLSKAMEYLGDAPDAVERVSSLYETWSGAVEKMKWIVDTVDVISEVHPYAKIAWSVLSFIPKLFLAQVERDANIEALLRAIHDAFDLTSVASALKTLKPGTKQTQILGEMLKHVSDCGDFIKTYAANVKFWERLLKNVAGGTDGRVERYKTTLTNLRDEFLRHATITTEMTVIKIQDDIGGLSVEIGQISSRLDGISSQVERVSGDIADVGMDAKIRDIPYPTGARFRLDKGCIPGTRAAFLDHITDWVNNPDSGRALVLFGQAGTGKSAIANELARRFCDMHRLSSSFVFSRSEQSKAYQPLLFTGLVRDLADRYATFRASLGKVVQNDTSVRHGAQDYKTVFDSLLLGPLSDSHIIGPVFIIIDGLDESRAAPGEGELHTFLAEHIQELPPNFRVLITSRFEQDIEEAFSVADSVDVLRMDDPGLAAKTGEDIRAYLKANLSPQVFEQHGSELESKSEGIFQWAAAACEYIKRPARGLTEKSRIARLLSPSPGGKRVDPLDDLYNKILDSCIDITDPDVQSLFRSVMGQLFAAFEPLSIRSLTALRQCDKDSQDDEDSVFVIVNGLGSLLSNVHSPDSTLPISPLHTSFRDFLTDKDRAGQFSVDLRDAHHDLAHMSLGMMDRDLHFNMCRLLSSFMRNSEVSDLKSRIAEHISAALAYACLFWDDHLDHIPLHADLVDTARPLFETKFPFWLESLSLLGKVQLAPEALTSLKKWLAGPQDDGAKFMGLDAFSALVEDALEFVLNFGMPIAQSAPHIYLSALPFTPASSLIRNRYAKLFPNTLSLRRGRLANWPTQRMVIRFPRLCGSIAFSPNGRRVVSGSQSGMICIWNVTTGQQVAELPSGYTGQIVAVAFSPDGRRIASGLRDNTIRVLNVATGKLIAVPFSGHKGAVESVAFSPDGEEIVSGSQDGTVRVWKATTGQPVAEPFLGHKSQISSVVFSPDGRRIASGSLDGTVRVWDAKTGEVAAGPFSGDARGITSVSFSPDGQRVASGSRDNTIRVWSVATGATVTKPFTGHTNRVTSVAFSPNGQHIVSGSADFTVRVWDTATGEPATEPFREHSRRVDSVAFSPDGQQIASSSFGGTIRIWNAKIKKVAPKPFDGHLGSILSVAFSPDGRRVASGSQDKTVRVWDTTTGRLVAGPFGRHTGGVNSVAFSPDSQYVVSGSADRTCCLWNVTTGELATDPFRGHSNTVNSVAFSPDGQRVASGSEDSSLQVWDVTTSKVVTKSFISDSGFGDEVASVAFSPDGRHIVSSSNDYKIRVWSAETGHLVVGPFVGNEDGFSNGLAVFSPNGQHIAFSSPNAAVRVWDWNTTPPRLISEPFSKSSSGGESTRSSVAYSPDGRLIASGTWNHTVYVRDVTTGQAVVGPLSGHDRDITCVAFSPDGRYVVSGSTDAAVRLWKMDSVSSEAGAAASSAQALKDSPRSPDHPPSEPGAAQVPITLTDDSTIDDDGWICGAGGELLVWVPGVHRVGLHRPGNAWVIAKGDTLLDLNKFVRGPDWEACKGDRDI